MNRIRKAIVAGSVAAGATVWMALQASVPQTVEDWAKLAGGAVAAGIIAGFATWRVPNAPAGPVR